VSGFGSIEAESRIVEKKRNVGWKAAQIRYAAPGRHTGSYGAHSPVPQSQYRSLGSGLDLPGSPGTVRDFHKFS
jgi:hypothetical protein